LIIAIRGGGGFPSLQILVGRVISLGCIFLIHRVKLRYPSRARGRLNHYLGSLKGLFDVVQLFVELEAFGLNGLNHVALVNYQLLFKLMGKVSFNFFNIPIDSTLDFVFGSFKPLGQIFLLFRESAC